jgi:hypothetical protein
VQGKPLQGNSCRETPAGKPLQSYRADEGRAFIHIKSDSCSLACSLSLSHSLLLSHTLALSLARSLSLARPLL